MTILRENTIFLQTRHKSNSHLQQRQEQNILKQITLKNYILENIYGNNEVQTTTWTHIKQVISLTANDLLMT